jgi:hypothetical protein
MKKMKKKLYALSGVFLIVLVITGLWAAKAVSFTGGVIQSDDPFATSLPSGLSVREMAEGASLIVIGTCVETRSQWIDRRLFTLATISVTEAIKGDASGTVTVVLPGGIDANRRIPLAMTYAGAPTISPEEEAFLFLRDQDEVANGYSVMGFAQGKYSVGQNEEGEKVVTSDQAKARVPTGAGLRRGNPRVVKLSEFKELVRSYLQ